MNQQTCELNETSTGTVKDHPHYHEFAANTTRRTLGKQCDGGVISEAEAHARCIRSETAWKRCGRKVLRDAVARYFVRPNQWTSDGKRLPRKVYTGFTQDQTEPWIKRQTKKQEPISIPVIVPLNELPQLSTNVHPESSNAHPAEKESCVSVINTPSPSPSITTGTVINQLFHDVILVGEEVTVEKIFINPVRQARPTQQTNTIRLLNPTNLLILKSFESYEESIRLLFHTIIWKRVQFPKEYDQDSFIRLKYDYLDTTIPFWRSLKPLLLRAGLVECDNHYIEGVKAMGYRLSPAYRDTPLEIVPIRARQSTRKRLEAARKSQLQLPIHEWLFENLQRIRIDYEAALAETPDHNADCYKGQIDSIYHGLWEFSVDAENSKSVSGRVNTNITRLYSPYRKHLRVDGSHLVQVDIRNSQPLALAILLKDHNDSDVKRYRELCQEGLLYDRLADLAEMTRDEAKHNLLIWFFSPNGSKNPVARFFREEFPSVAKWIREVKRKDYRKLAHHLQRAEADFVIHSVCYRLMLTHSDWFVGTIHDSILCLPEHGEEVRAVMLDEFATLGMKPELKVEPV